jgi:hypothetical protein
VQVNDVRKKAKARSGQRLQQLRLHLDLRPVVLQLGTIDQECVVHPLAQGGDLGWLWRLKILSSNGNRAFVGPAFLGRSKQDDRHGITMLAFLSLQSPHPQTSHP